jgi:hypothetical protein
MLAGPFLVRTAFRLFTMDNLLTPKTDLSDGSNDKIQAVIEAGIPRRLVELLMHASTSVQTPALRSVGNIGNIYLSLS